MAFAVDSYTATGGQTNFTITFSFITDPDHVVVTQNGSTITEGAGNDYTITGGNTVVLNTGATVGDIMVIRRTSGQSARLVDWTVPSTMSETDLDNDSLQAFYMSQEAIDIANEAFGKTSDLTDWDAESLRIENLATPAAATDAVTKAYADAIATNAGNVPTPDNPGEDGYVLRASGGTFAWYDWLGSNNTITGDTIISGAFTASGATATISATTANISAATTNVSGVANFTGTGLKTFTAPFVLTKGGDIASASPLVIDTDGNYFDVTGTTGYAAMTVAAGRWFMLHFDGALTMTHGAGLFLPNAAANITTAAGDHAICYATAADTVRVVDYIRADGTALVDASFGAATYVSSEQTITSAGNLTLTHSLGRAPYLVQMWLHCDSADGNYAAGDEVMVPIASISTAGINAIIENGNTTQIYIRFGSNANAINIRNKTTGADLAITNANWKLIVKAW